MREKEMIDRMQQNIEIPDIVRQKAGEALQKVQSGDGKSSEGKKAVSTRSYKRKWKTMWVAAAAVVFALGTMTAGAAYIHWSKGLEARFQATEEQKRLLEENQFTELLGQNNSVTSKGVTITAEQSIADSRFAWLSFKIEGYEPEEGKDPLFNFTTISVEGEGKPMISYSSSFYNGLYYDEDKGFLYEDGTPAAKDADGNIIKRYVDDDGSMEYVIVVDYTSHNLIGKTLHITFQDLGATDTNHIYTVDLEAKWELTIELKGSEEVRSMELSAPLGETGVIVTYAEISPVSLYVNYNFPIRKEDIPGIVGVQLKDGTLLTDITSAGSIGFQGGTYTESFATNHILETEEVDALLFLKSDPGGSNKLTEENLYIVPIE